MHALAPLEEKPMTEGKAIYHRNEAYLRFDLVAASCGANLTRGSSKQDEATEIGTNARMDE
jgi:hypothetical protein